MRRKKVLYGYIHNDTARKASLKKRRPGFLKKVKELSILCGIKACVVVYSPNEQEPAFWPSKLEVEQILLQYEAIPYMEKNAKKIDQVSYLTERVKKLQEQVKQIDWTNKEMEYSNYLHQIFRGGKSYTEFQQTDLDDLRAHVVEKLSSLKRRRQFMYPAPVQETLIEAQGPAMATQVKELGSSNNNVAANNPTAVSVVPDDDISHLLLQDSSVFGVDSGAIGGYAMEMYNGGDDIGGNNWVYNMNLHEQVVEGGGNGNATVFSHGNTEGSEALYGWSQPIAEGFNANQGLANHSTGFNENQYNWNHIDGSIHGYVNPNPYVGHQESVNVSHHSSHHGSGLPIGDINGNGGSGHLPQQGLLQDIIQPYVMPHGLSNNPMEVEPPNFGFPAPNYNPIGDSMEQYPGNQQNGMNMY